MLVLETGILLVHADDVLEMDRSTLCISTVAIKILDVTETVAAQGELVSSNTETNVSDIKGLLAVVRCARVYFIKLDH